MDTWGGGSYAPRDKRESGISLRNEIEQHGEGSLVLLGDFDSVMEEDKDKELLECQVCLKSGCLISK